MAKSDKNHPEQAKQAGAVRHDARGNAVWHWAAGTARNAIVSTSQLLRRLDLSGLSLEDEQPPKGPGKPGSGNPTPGKPANPAAGQPAPPTPAASPGELKLSATGRPGRPRGYNPYEGGPAPPAPAARNRPALPKPARASWWRRLFQRR